MNKNGKNIMNTSCPLRSNGLSKFLINALAGQSGQGLPPVPVSASAMSHMALHLIFHRPAVSGPHSEPV